MTSFREKMVSATAINNRKAQNPHKSVGDDEISRLKAHAEVQCAIYKESIKPLQAEYGTASPERKQEIKELSKTLRLPQQAAETNFRIAKHRHLLRSRSKEVAIPIPNRQFKAVVYHQTSSEFDYFDLSKSADGTAWFTIDKKNFSDPSSSASAASGNSIVLERFVTLEKVAGFEAVDRFTIDELTQQGYDGALLDGDIQVFDEGSIRKLMSTHDANQVLVAAEKVHEYLVEKEGCGWFDGGCFTFAAAVHEIFPDTEIYHVSRTSDDFDHAVVFIPQLNLTLDADGLQTKEQLFER